MSGTSSGRKRRNSSKPKGRQLDDQSLVEIRNLLGSSERRRDLLIEFLHKIQDKFGCIHARHIRALAEEMRLSQVEVYEVASFYDHFDVVKEGEAEPAPLTIRVCDSITCMCMGADKLMDGLKSSVDASEIRVVPAPCMGGCDVAPAARIGDREVGHATVESLLSLAQSGETEALQPGYDDLETYRSKGGYAIWEKVKSGALSADGIIEKLSDASLRGLGGAGFPTGKKWSFVRGYDSPRLMTINGDEGEPGTFKDRYYLERNPHAMFEGALIGAHVVGAERCYVYMRDEYPAVLNILREEIAAIEAAGVTEPSFFELRRGAGAYN